ncbi:uncharacterized protein LOC114276169 [Camellia sinensis]|uniref:uncharacterized protein LOC114276169 n=1 Tax=Camellia sinensis TaxID=4442 RepID=UPI0010356A9C|nr:uncharacterized protein LOC114276169 [Camellia sinensis]
MEIVEHMLFDCEWTKAVWFGSMLNFLMEHGAITNVAQWTTQWGDDGMFKESGKEILSKTALIGWYIWKARNDFTFNFVPVNPYDTLQKIHHWWNECNLQGGEKNTVASADSSREYREGSGWTPSQVGNFKVNCDASFNRSSTNASAAAILGDSKGHIIDGVITSFFSALALQAEAYAVRLACRLAQMNGLYAAKIENDNQELIKLCVSETVPL